MQHRVPASLTELNNVFLVAIKNQPLTDQINFEKVELFEMEELNEELRTRIKKFIQAENFCWTSDHVKNEQNLEEHIKSLVSIQDIFKNTSKIPKTLKETVILLKHVFKTREQTMRMIAKLNEDVHLLNFETVTKTLFGKLDGTQKLGFSSGGELEHLKTYHDLVIQEVSVLKALFATLEIMQKMDFCSSLITLTKYKRILTVFRSAKDKALEPSKEEPLMLAWYTNFHLHLTAKLRLYYREILDFPSIKNEERMLDPNLLVRILEPFETFFPDTLIFVIAKQLPFSNPFFEIDIDPTIKYKYIQVFKGFIMLFGPEDETGHEALFNVAGLIDESYELLNAYLNKSMQKLVGKDVHYYFISRIDTNIYLGLFAKNYRGKRLEKILSKLLLIVDILRNNYVKDVSTYHHMIFD